MRYLLYCFLLFFPGCLYAQADKKGCEYHYFKSGKVSTSECYESGPWSGKSKAFNRKGEVIYEKSIRKVGGHSSVNYQYYDDGAVKKAEWSEAPDAGIQWYRSVTMFSEDGKVTDFNEQSYDDMRMPVIKKQPGIPQKHPDPVKKPATQTMECAVIYSSEFWFINAIGYTVTVNAESKNKGGESFTITLKAGTMAKGGSRVLAQQFENPYNYYNITIVPDKHKKNAKPGITFLAESPDPASKEKRRYYFKIE